MQKILLLSFFLTGNCLLQAQENKYPAPAGTIRVEGDTLLLGGVRLELDQQGFPGQIDSMLAENIHFHFTRLADGKDIRLNSEGLVFTRQEPVLVEWRTTLISDELKIVLNAVLRSEGSLSYKVSVTALQDLELKEIAMHIPLRPDSHYTWKKDTTRADRIDVSVGTPHTGLRYLLHSKEWNNQGKGGIIVGIKGRSLLVNNYSGARSMKKEDSIDYDFVLAILPKPPY